MNACQSAASASQYSWGFFLFGLRRLLDFLAVFVEAGQEKNFLTQAAPCARDDVGNDLLISMAEVRLPVDVINRGGDVKPFAHRTHSVAHKEVKAISLAASTLRVIMASGCRGNQPANKHRMNQLLSSFAARLRELIANWQSAIGDEEFSKLALELFTLQFKHNSAYRKICTARRLTPDVVGHWDADPFVPTAAFKELQLTSLAPDEITLVFHSSGTTEQTPSRHFHNTKSLAVYEASLWKWFQKHFGRTGEFVFLTPTTAVRRARRWFICLKPCGRCLVCPILLSRAMFRLMVRGRLILI